MTWQVGSSLLLALAVGVGFVWYEHEKPPARVLALVAALAALAVVGRLVFAAIPNVKPTTDIVLFAGYALGAAPGFVVGAVTALVSNIFFGQGPWTVWQMAGWGAVGVGGALLARVLRRRDPGRLVLAAACGLAGLAFGAWMDVYQWTLGARQDLDSYLVVATSSLPYNLAHAVGNVAFCLLIGPVFIRALERYRRRLEVSWQEPVARAGALTGALLALLVVLPAAVHAATPAERAERYLVRAQNADGGFGAAPRQASSPLYSGWTGLGLAAAGRNARDVARRRSLASYVRALVPRLRDIGEIERTVLLLRSAGLDPRRTGGRDLLRQIEARRRADGSIAGFVSYTAFGVLALRASGQPVGAATVRWLLASQKPDGGFGVARSSPSDSDMTGAVLQALAVVGRKRSAAARRAVRYLRAGQGSDGGFGQREGGSSNAQSTAYAVQGLVAAGARGRSLSRALAYLVRLQRRDGSIAYSSSSAQTPVWVTAQALAALRRAPLPIAPVPRAARASAPADESASAGGSPSGGPGGAAGAGGAAAPAGSAGRAERESTEGEAAQREERYGPVQPEGSGAPAPGAGGLTLDEPRRDSERAGAATDDGGPGMPIALVLAVLALTGALVWGFRRRLFRGSRPASS